eukprot:jgi/Tetstr1/440618/TSEL_028928.t1
MLLTRWSSGTSAYRAALRTHGWIYLLAICRSTGHQVYFARHCRSCKILPDAMPEEGPQGFDLLSFLKNVGKPAEAGTVPQDVSHVMAPPAVGEAEKEAGHGAAPPAAAAQHGAGSSVDQRILDTAHSSAANAFAAAAGTVSSGATSSATPKGRVLPMQQRLVYDVTNTNPDEAQPELEVSPITKVNSEYAEQLRQQVAVNNGYICYSLRQGHVRVLNKVSAARALHKAHTGAVTELRLFSDTVNKVVSCGMDHSVFVYEVKEGPGAEEITIEPIVSYSLEVENKEGSIMTAAWHPLRQDLIAFTANESAYVCGIEGQAGNALTITPTSVPSGVTKLSTTALVTNAAFSASGNMLAVGAENGTVSIWKYAGADTSTGILAALSSSAPAVVLSPYAQACPTRVYWVPAMPGVDSEVLMTGGPVNRDLCLWSVPPTGSSNPGLVQQLLLDGPGGDASFFNHVHLKPELQLVIIANTKTKSVYTVQYSLQADPTLPIRFSYIARFSVTMPILSMTGTWNSPLADGPQETIQLYCVQTQAVQQYTLRPEMCCPPPQAPAEAAAPHLTSVMLKRRADLLGGPAAASDIDAAEIASSAGFATAGSACDPTDLPEPGAETASVAGDAYDEDVLPDAADGALPTLYAPSEESASSGLPPRAPAPKLLTPTELLASAHRFATASPTLSRSGSLEVGTPPGVPPPPPTPVAPLSACGSTADFTAAAATATGHEAPTAAMINSTLSRLAESSRDRPARPSPAPPASDLSSQVLAQLQDMQASIQGLETRFGARFAAKMNKLGDRLDAQAEVLTAALQAQAQAQSAVIQEQMAAQAASQKQAMEELLAIMSASMHRELPQLLKTTMKAHADSMVTQISSAAGSAIAAAVAEQMRGALPGPVQAAVQQALADKLEPALTGPVQAGMQSCFASTLLPGFERAVGEMFGQLNTAVTAGLREHAEAASVQAVRAVTEQLGPTNAAVEAVRRDLAQYQAQLESGGHGQAGQTPAAPASAAGKALSLAELEAQQDPTVQLQQLVARGALEEAFTKALSLSHVETVIWLCKTAGVREVLAAPGKLSQGVLLSLAQQLGCDLGRAVDMRDKLDWIQDLCLVLDTGDALLAPHMRPILSQLLANLQQAEAAAPREDASTFRIVTHIVKSLLTTCK